MKKTLFKGGWVLPPKLIKPHANEMGQRLRLYRKSLGMIGQKFCKYIKISQGSLSDLENGKSKPSADTFIKLYKKGCDIHWLLTGDK